MKRVVRVEKFFKNNTRFFASMYVAVFAIAILVYPVDSPLASPITKIYEFSATDFFPTIGTATPPEDTVSGSFSLTYDTALDTVGGMLNDIDLTIAGFTYSVSNTAFNYNSTFDNLTVGGVLNGIDATAGISDDFIMSFRASTLSSTFFASFLYITSTTPLGTPGFLADTRIPPSNVTVSERVVTVPEPSILSLLILGLVGAGLMQFRNKKTQARQ